jgi:uncharacterized protein YjiS (DUF1127 family)
MTGLCRMHVIAVSLPAAAAATIAMPAHADLIADWNQRTGEPDMPLPSNAPTHDTAAWPLGWVRRLSARLQQAVVLMRRAGEAARMLAALNELDDRTLVDLGLRRSELRSLCAEAQGHVEATRQRVHRP